LGRGEGGRGLANKDCPIGVHMFPYHRTLGDKKLRLAFFIAPTNDIQFMFGHGSGREFLQRDFVHLSSGTCLVMKG